jgi:hypothetical protein
MRKGYERCSISLRTHQYVPLPGDIKVDHLTLLVLHGDNWRDTRTQLLAIKETLRLAEKLMTKDDTV